MGVAQNSRARATQVLVFGSIYPGAIFGYIDLSHSHFKRFPRRVTPETLLASQLWIGMFTGGTIWALTHGQMSGGHRSVCGTELAHPLLVSLR